MACVIPEMSYRSLQGRISGLMITLWRVAGMQFQYDDNVEK